MTTQMSTESTERSNGRKRKLNEDGPMVAMAQRIQELQAEVELLRQLNQQGVPVDLRDPMMDATAEFAIVSVEPGFDGPHSFVEIKGVHGDTGEQETIRVPLRNPTPSIVRVLKKLEGHRLSKPTRTLIPDVTKLGGRFIKITPFEALMLLKRNVKQRPLQMGRVQRYVQAHADGSWLACNQGIGIDWDGNIFDGQHRTFAVLLTGKAMPVFLAWGVDPKAREVVDTGAGRTPGQVDDMHGVCETLPSGVTIQTFTNKIYQAHGGTTNKSPLFYGSIKNHYLESLEWAYQYTHPRNPRYPYAKKTVLKSAAVVSALLLLHQAFGDEVEMFAEMVLAPVPATTDPTILLIREYLDERSRRDTGASKDKWLDQAYKVITGYLAWKKGTKFKLKSLPTRKHASRKGSLAKQRRDVFYRTLQHLWDSNALLPEDVLKTVGWAPNQKG